MGIKKKYVQYGGINVPSGTLTFVFLRFFSVIFNLVALIMF